MSKPFLLILGILFLAAAGAMYLIGKDDTHLSELYDYCLIPVPPGLLLLVAGLSKKRKETN